MSSPRFWLLWFLPNRPLEHLNQLLGDIPIGWVVHPKEREREVSLFIYLVPVILFTGSIYGAAEFLLSTVIVPLFCILLKAICRSYHIAFQTHALTDLSPTSQHGGCGKKQPTASGTSSASSERKRDSEPLNWFFSRHPSGYTYC